jgi:hypothetical protein
MGSPRGAHVIAMVFCVERTMATLSEAGAMFHSERDFRFALTWQIQVEHAEAKVRLGTRSAEADHLDLLVTLPEERVAIELTYWVDQFGRSI